MDPLAVPSFNLLTRQDLLMAEGDSRFVLLPELDLPVPLLGLLSAQSALKLAYLMAIIFVNANFFCQQITLISKADTLK